MTDIETPIGLTPLQRLQLRDCLQDDWREQVQRITELSVAMHGLLDNGSMEDRSEAAAVAVSLSEARSRLVEIEDSMRHLDGRLQSTVHHGA